MQPPIERWGVVADLRPLAGGHRNQAFRTVGLARELVFKSTRRSSAAILWLVKVQQIARQSGFVVPDMIRCLDGDHVADRWTCEPLVEGRPFEPEEMPTILPLVSAFHTATLTVRQRPGFLSSRALLRKTVGGDVDLTAMPTELVARCRDAWCNVSDRTMAVVHGDLNCTNLIRCPDGRAALIDWDECRRDLVLFDLGPLGQGCDAERRARLAWEVACSWVLEPDHAKSCAAHV